MDEYRYADPCVRRQADQALWKARQASPPLQKRDILYQQEFCTGLQQVIGRGLYTFRRTA